jgi:hypothetical protein
MVRYEAYDARRFSQITLQIPLHHADPRADHEPAAGLLGDRSCERGAGEGERAADCQRFFALRAVVGSWGLSGAILLDPSLSGFGPIADMVASS